MVWLLFLQGRYFYQNSSCPTEKGGYAEGHKWFFRVNSFLSGLLINSYTMVCLIVRR